MKLNKDAERYAELYRNGFLYDEATKTIYRSNPKKKVPEPYEDWIIEDYKKDDYLKQRLKELGITPAKNIIELYGGLNIPQSQKNGHKIFNANKFGDIEILQYDLDRQVLTFKPKGLENDSVSNREQYRYQTRLHPYHESMCVGKYDFTNALNTPFWHKNLIEQYEKKENVETFGITEGQFKSFTASQYGLNIVGLTSISHYKSKKTNTIHADIIKYLKACEVEKLVILWDGDCRNISSSAIENKEDLAKRPNDFYKFASTIRKLVQDFFPARKLQIYFATIKTEDLNEHPKGIDDLLNAYQKNRKEIKKDFEQIGEMPCKYFDWINITLDNGVKNMRAYFYLDFPSNFYKFHEEQIGKQDFVFFGTVYKIENGEPLKKIDANVKNYKRIGNDWYNYKMVPVLTSKDGEFKMEKELLPWSKTNIVEDHTKHVIPHIERFDKFVNFPSHINYRQVINGCWNLYHDLQHDTREGDFPYIEKLLKHLFQDQYTMILDYLTILYRKPTEKLPVICLVSRLQSTGKSTFISLLKMIFGQNMANISSQDLIGDFNAHWTSKLVVASEETLLEKKEAYEKIKSYTTADKINRNEKNKSNQEIDCFVHFVFCSNHEDDFIKIDDNDSRLWIRKIGKIKEQINNIKDLMENEISYFVHFLMNREIVNPKKDRLWFSPDQFRTDAFQNVVKHSEPALIKELREHLEESFITTGAETQCMTTTLIKNEFGLRFDRHYIGKEITRTLKIERSSPSTFKFYKKNLSTKKIEGISGKGRYFTFNRKDFVKQEPKTKPKEPKQTSMLDYDV